MDIGLWRARIGTFTQPFKRRLITPVLVIGNVSLGIRVLLFLLLAMQCVETNPGPGPGSRSSRGQGARGVSSGYSPTNSSSRGRGAGNSSVSNEQRNLRSSSATTPAAGMHNVLGTSSASQLPINAWFGSPNATNTMRGTPDTNMTELKEIMLDIQRSQNNMETRFSNFEVSLNNVTESHKILLESNKLMTESVDNLTQKVDKLEERL